MSGSAPVQVVAAVFDDELSASIALEWLRARQEIRLGIKSAAVLRKDTGGELRIKEAMGGGRGAAFGGTAGAAVGLIAGPALVVPAAVGALIGGLAARARKSGLSHERLERLGEELPAGSSALVAVIDQNWVRRIEGELAREGATVLSESLHGNIAEQLEAEHDAVYAEVAASHGLTPSGGTDGISDAAAEGTIAGDDEVVGSRWVATREGFVAHDTEAKGKSG
jgi:uncharacterized membrane protein